MPQPIQGTLCECLAHYYELEQATFSPKEPYVVRQEMARLSGQDYTTIRQWLKGRPTAFINQYAALLVLEALGYQVTDLDLVRSGSKSVRLDQISQEAKNLGYLLGAGIYTTKEMMKALGYVSTSQLIPVINGQGNVFAAQFDPERRLKLKQLLISEKHKLEQVRADLGSTLTKVRERLFLGAISHKSREEESTRESGEVVTLAYSSEELVERLERLGHLYQLLEKDLRWLATHPDQAVRSAYRKAVTQRNWRPIQSLQVALVEEGLLERWFERH